MNNSEPTASDAAGSQEIVRQADCEFAILLDIEEALRIALQRTTRTRVYV